MFRLSLCSLGVQNFPRKAKKKAAREQTSTVCVVCKVCKGGQQSFLIMQRPEKGKSFIVMTSWQQSFLIMQRPEKGNSLLL